MSTSGVKHIIVKMLGEGYSRTLCGRYVQVFGRTRTYSDPDYFNFERPNCQDCLRKHFKGKKARSQ